MTKDEKEKPTGLDLSEAYENDEYDSWEKKTYVKHIRNDLKRWCTADELAEAIGGAFTPGLVNEIYGEIASGSKRKTKNGKILLDRDLFLEHFEANLVIR